MKEIQLRGKNLHGDAGKLSAKRHPEGVYQNPANAPMIEGPQRDPRIVHRRTARGERGHDKVIRVVQPISEGSVVAAPDGLQQDLDRAELRGFVEEVVRAALEAGRFELGKARSW